MFSLVLRAGRRSRADGRARCCRCRPPARWSSAGDTRSDRSGVQSRRVVPRKSFEGRGGERAPDRARGHVALAHQQGAVLVAIFGRAEPVELAPHQRAADGQRDLLAVEGRRSLAAVGGGGQALQALVAQEGRRGPAQMSVPDLVTTLMAEPRSGRSRTRSGWWRSGTPGSRPGAGSAAAPRPRRRCCRRRRG